MATINVSFETKRQAKSILSKVYKSDRSSAFCNNGNSVSGSVLTATIKDEYVEIMSSYYLESSLSEMFGKI